MRKLFQYGGIAASIVLIAFGIGAIYMGIDGRGYVRDNLAAEKIVGTEDSTIPGQLVDTGAEAQAFAKVMREHTLESTGGKTYSEMGRFLDANGKDTNDEKAAAINEQTGKPVENGLRNMWVTETALTTALNTAYFAEQVAHVRHRDGRGPAARRPRVRRPDLPGADARGEAGGGPGQGQPVCGGLRLTSASLPVATAAARHRAAVVVVVVPRPCGEWRLDEYYIGDGVS